MQQHLMTPMKHLLTGILVFFIVLLHMGKAADTWPSQQNDTVYPYWVFFTDKDGVSFDPYTYFHPKAIERRMKHNQNLFDSLDFPVKQVYLDSLAASVDSICIISRWFNATFVYATEVQMADVTNLGFVKHILRPRFSLIPADIYEEDDYSEESFQQHRMAWPFMHEEEQLQTQINHMGGQYFADNGFYGQHMRIAVFDAGFPGVDTHPAFEHIRDEGRIAATWDFHRNSAHVYGYNNHGTKVLSLIAGMHNNVMMGMATGSDFLLARTEIRREPLAEEKYWIAATEWADRLGADVINSSLGYIHHRYFPEQMDGQTSLIARAASIAARKGLLIVNAAGNEGGNDRWRIINTPADTDSVLTVGAVDFPSLLRTSYSSLGPTADFRMKPNVVAMGNVLATANKGLSRTQGTSFSSPLVAGFAICLWQMFPDWTNMQVFRAIEQSASLYPYFDYAHGYGVPQAKHFFEHPQNVSRPTFDIIRRDQTISVVIRQNPAGEEAETNNDRYVYYHIRNTDGIITEYHVIRADTNDVLSFDVNNDMSGNRLFVHFNGYTASHIF